MRVTPEPLWIAFDAVGTLITPDPPVAEVYHRIGQKHGSRLSRTEVDLRFRDVFGRRAADGELSSNEAAEREFWRIVVGQVLDDVTDREGCFEELHAWFAMPAAWRCYNDVAGALASLRECGYRLAIASNFDGRLHSVRNGLPELEAIETCVVSSEVGWRKPHAGFFAALVERCGCSPEQILMVGDDLRVDVCGAEHAGLRAVWLQRTAESISEPPRKDTIRSLSELADVLTRDRLPTGPFSSSDRQLP